MKKSYITRHYWSQEEDAWLKDNFQPNLDRTKLLADFNSKFSTNITIIALNQRCAKYRLLTLNSDYTTEMEEWLINNYDLTNKTAQELTDEFNNVFGTNKTKSSIWHKAYRLTNRRVSDEPKTRLEYTPDMIEYIKEIVPLWSYKKCAELMSEKFKYKFTSSMIEHKANRLGVKKPNNGFNNLDPRLPSINWFMKGRPSIFAKPVGTETIMEYSNGIKWIHVKVAEPSVWEYKHRLVWKQHYGDIPDDKMIIFLDGNTLNCDINNLACISKGEHGYMNAHNLRFKNVDLTKTGLALTKLILAKSKRKEKKK